jgi:hypothetical protein
VARGEQESKDWGGMAVFRCATAVTSLHFFSFFASLRPSRSVQLEATEGGTQHTRHDNTVKTA